MSTKCTFAGLLLTLSLAFSLSACDSPEPASLAPSGDAIPAPAATAAVPDPIAFVGHGSLFGRDGKPLAATPELAREIQASYVGALLERAAPEQAKEFAAKRAKLVGDQRWDARAELYADAALVDWLIKEVNPANAGDLAAHNAVLQRALTFPAAQTDAPFDVPAALTQLLTEEGLAGDATLLSTSSGGQAYIDECKAAGVPTPPKWGTSQWKPRGELTSEFLDPSLKAEVYTFQSSSPEGMCIALPRSSGNNIKLLGIICLGKATSNVCFWDNQKSINGTVQNYDIPLGTQVSITSGFRGGGDLVASAGGMCTDCHSGENPYVLHPGTKLGQPNLDGLPLRGDSWYKPMVRADWLQNAGPSTVLDGVNSPGKCTNCHTQGFAGRFPVMSTSTPGYCSVVLENAIARTMPPGGTGGVDYSPHINALRNACRNPPPQPPSLVSPRLPPYAAVNAVSRSTDKLDIFATDENGVVYTAAWEPAFADWWHGWWQLNGGRAHPGSPVYAVSRSRDKLDAFVIGTDGRVYTAAWEPTFTDWWHGWWQLNGGAAALGAHVTVVSRGTDKLDAFVVGLDGHVYTANWQPDFTDWWHGWYRIGDITVPQGAPIHAVSRSAGMIDIFATDVNGVIWTAAFDSAGWHGWWELIGGRAAPGAPVTAVSRAPDKLDVFVVGQDGRVWTAAWEPAFTDWWHGWWPIGDIRFPAGAPIHGVSRSRDKLDIFGTDVNGVVRTAAWEPAFGWRGWWELNGGRAAPGAPVTAVSRGADKLDVFVVGLDKRIWTAAWESTFTDWWHGWWPIGQ